MKRSTPPPNAEDLRRFDRIRTQGCIACRMGEHGHIPPEIHHLLNTGRHGGKRLGHRYTVGLCQWHHRGVVPIGMKADDVEAEFGPSLQRTARAFRELYGEDAALLAYQDRILKLNYGCAAAPPLE